MTEIKIGGRTVIDAHDNSRHDSVPHQQRYAIQVLDVDGNQLREILVPFGLVDIGGLDAVMHFGRLVVARHHETVTVLEERLEDLALIVADNAL